MSNDFIIPFNKPFIVGKELSYISQAVTDGHLAGDGYFTKCCNAWMEEHFEAKNVLLTTSCTAALEMAALLTEIQPGDEVIMPSYTFVSTANAFVLRGARIQFIDIRPDTLNMDENLIEAAITQKTKAIVPVHYAGVACEMGTIMDIADTYKLFVVEDAAQGVNATYNGKYLGTIGHLGTYSFHETKNFISGEGGALIVNDDRFLERAEVIREKGTNRSRFFRGEIDKYTWVDMGSSYLPSEIIAAFLYAQLEESDKITRKRWHIFNYYMEHLEALQEQGLLQLPGCPENCTHNAHMFYIITRDSHTRDKLLQFLKEKHVHAIFHYVPLHTAPMGRTLGYDDVELPVTEDLSARLIRLPCYFELSQEEQDRVISCIHSYFSQ